MNKNESENSNEPGQRLLSLLNDNQYHAIEEVASLLAIKTCHVPQVIRKLIDLGIDIEAHHVQGYRISNDLELLDHYKILSCIAPEIQSALDELIILKTVDSTNDFLLQQINKQQTIACFAEHQSKARGQHGRRWVSPFGTNLYHSMLWHFPKKPQQLLGLSLAVAVIVVQALKEYGVNQQNLSIKWPNDIFCNGQKIAGILIEIVNEPSELRELHQRNDYQQGNCSAVIGIGLNTYMTAKQAVELEHPWTTIHHITQTKVNRNHLAGLLVHHLLQSLPQFAEHGFKAFMPQWQELDHLFGKTITLQTINQELTGEMKGVNDDGALILLDQHHQPHYYFNGDAKLKK